jgi:hypothetical protein
MQCRLCAKKNHFSVREEIPGPGHFAYGSECVHRSEYMPVKDFHNELSGDEQRINRIGTKCE